VDVYNKHYTQLKPLFLPPRSPNGTKGTTNTTLKSFTQGMVVTTNFSNVVACMNPTQQALVQSYVSVPNEASMHWSLDSTIFFVATVFTTIGYGSFAPVTNFGKLYTSILAIIGVMHFGFVLGLATMQILNVLQFIASKVKKNKQTQEAVVLRITFAASTLYVFCLAFLALAPNLNWGYGNGRWQRGSLQICLAVDSSNHSAHRTNDRSKQRQSNDEHQRQGQHQQHTSHNRTSASEMWRVIAQPHGCKRNDANVQPVPVPPI
jgi:hypothetical protein